MKLSKSEIEGQHTQQSWGIDTQKLSQDKTIDEKAVLENNLFPVPLYTTCRCTALLHISTVRKNHFIKDICIFEVF